MQQYRSSLTVKGEGMAKIENAFRAFGVAAGEFVERLGKAFAQKAPSQLPVEPVEDSWDQAWDAYDLGIEDMPEHEETSTLEIVEQEVHSLTAGISSDETPDEQAQRIRTEYFHRMKQANDHGGRFVREFQAWLEQHKQEVENALMVGDFRNRNARYNDINHTDHYLARGYVISSEEDPINEDDKPRVRRKIVFDGEGEG